MRVLAVLAAFVILLVAGVVDGVRRLPLLWLYRDGKLVTRDTREAVTELSALR